jgi:energy-converting hydrogenase Eha subunit H
METIQHIILPLIIIVILLYIVWNLLRKLEKLEDNMEEQDGVLDSVETSVRRALARMKEVDRIGSFEADDESGFVFKEIQTALDKLNNEINENA